MALPTLIVLAGGASSRMWPLREKSLIRFGESPLLLDQLRRYQALGFARAVIVANPGNADLIAGLVGQVEGLAVQTAVQPDPKGMGDALLQAAPMMPDGPLYITQVHDVVDERLHTNMLAAHQADPTATYLAGVQMAAYFPGGYLEVDADGRIVSIVEKPGADKRPSDLVNIVAHVHADAGQLFDAIRAEYEKAATPDDHYERAMDRLMKDRRYQVVPYEGPWRALKYPWHVLDVMDAYLQRIDGQHISESAYVAPGAAVLGNVVIEAGAKLFHGAAVVGPAYIGRNTIVGNGALVRHSMVLDHCEVGYTTEIARSYVGDHVGMHACRVLDSVFAPHVNFSAGCTTANLRIDHGRVPSYVKGQKLDSGRDKFGAVIGEGAFLAVDVMTMPGVKIGEGAQIGPGTHVIRDVQDGQRVYVKQEVVVYDLEDSD